MPERISDDALIAQWRYDMDHLAMAEEYDRVAFEYKFLFAERLVPRD